MALISLSSRLVFTLPKRPDHLVVPRVMLPQSSLFASGACNILSHRVLLDRYCCHSCKFELVRALSRFCYRCKLDYWTDVIDPNWDLAPAVFNCRRL